jgi:uncharacterized protein (TIGR00251 family)
MNSGFMPLEASRTGDVRKRCGGSGCGMKDNEGKVAVRVHPGARRDAVTGTVNGVVKISLKTPPVDGKANEALLRFLAEVLGVRKVDVELVSGAGSRSKVVRVHGRSGAELLAALLLLVV